jgi:hypothetical protein
MEPNLNQDLKKGQVDVIDPKISPYKNDAYSMVKHILGYEPHEQNEMVHIIRQNILQRRNAEITDIETRLKYLKETLENF